MELLGYVAMMCVGLILGLLGSGGSMLAIPVLIYIFSMDIESASSYSLFLVGVTSLTGAALRQKEQLLSLRAGLLFGLPSILTTFMTRKWLLPVLPESFASWGTFQLMKEDALVITLALMMIGSSVMMWRSVSTTAPGEKFNHLRLILAGLVVGMLGGLVGVGGGFLILPALIFFAGIPIRTAVGTTLLIIACNSLLGFCGDILNHAVNWYFLLTITGLSVGGLLFGEWVHQRLSAPFRGHTALAWVMMLTGVSMIVKQLL
jgi:uncharacterized membrane protein YfcA